MRSDSGMLVYVVTFLGMKLISYLGIDESTSRPLGSYPPAPIGKD